MSKKSALGNIPSFDLGNSVGNINGIPISNAETPKEEEIKKDKEKVLTEIKEVDSEEELIKEMEKESKNYNDKFLDILEKEKERFKNRSAIYENKEDNIKDKIANLNVDLDSDSKPTKKDIRPSNKKHLKEGYTRQTFAVKDEHLELLRAIASFKGIEQKQLLEALLNKAFDSIDAKTKEEALSYYRNDEEAEDLDLFI